MPGRRGEEMFFFFVSIKTRIAPRASLWGQRWRTRLLSTEHAYGGNIKYTILMLRFVSFDGGTRWGRARTCCVRGVPERGRAVVVGVGESKAEATAEASLGEGILVACDEDADSHLFRRIFVS